MAICNVLVKTISLPPKKFLVLLDAAVKNQITSFQIMPAGMLSADSGDADTDPLSDPNETPILCDGPGSGKSTRVLMILEGATNPLYVGQQGTGHVSDNRKGTSDALLWKVVSIAGPHPKDWSTMDIYQDLPDVPENRGIA